MKLETLDYLGGKFGDQRFTVADYIGPRVPRPWETKDVADEFGYPDLSVFGRSVYNVVLEVQNRTSLLLARARSTMMKPDFDVGITSTLS